MAAQLLALLARAQAAAAPLAFVVVLPGWLDSAGWQALAASPLRRATLQLAAADHGFVDGAQHTRAYAFRQSPYDTTLFFLQTDAAAAAHPLGAAALERVERAMASCTPTEADLAQVELHERVERGSARRRLARTRRRVSAAAGEGAEPSAASDAGGGAADPRRAPAAGPQRAPAGPGKRKRPGKGVAGKSRGSRGSDL
eukprot:Transcript_23376.p2 GENE.Transcript_23376~~Transcript_23376.p2  ORF type:complete len:199 (+),score=70.06 Transcript_23376:525-1121(+)